MLVYLLYPGASKSVYAPEPFDVGRILQAEIIYDGQLIILTTTSAIDPGLLCCFFYAYFYLFMNLVNFYFSLFIEIYNLCLFVRAASGLGNYVEALVRKHDVEFNVCCHTSKNSPIYG